MDEDAQRYRQRLEDPQSPRLLHDEEDARHLRVANFDACPDALAAAPIEINAPIVAAYGAAFTPLPVGTGPAALDVFALGTALRLVHAVIAGYLELMDWADVLGEW